MDVRNLGSKDVERLVEVIENELKPNNPKITYKIKEQSPFWFSKNKLLRKIIKK
jgi:hypothetical protein